MGTNALCQVSVQHARSPYPLCPAPVPCCVAEAALRAAFVAAMLAIPEGKRTVMLDPNAPADDDAPARDAAADSPDHNPLASLLGHYRQVALRSPECRLLVRNYSMPLPCA